MIAIGLAKKFESGEITSRKLVEATDEEILNMLMRVKGIGLWTVQVSQSYINLIEMFIYL